MLHLRDVFISCFHTKSRITYTRVLLQFPLKAEKACYSCELIKRQISCEIQQAICVTYIEVE